MRGFLSALWQSGKNKPGVGRKRRTRARDSLHEWLTKNHGFLTQPTGASATISPRRAARPRRAVTAWLDFQVPHPPYPTRKARPREEIRRRCAAQLNTILQNIRWCG